MALSESEAQGGETPSQGYDISRTRKTQNKNKLIFRPQDQHKGWQKSANFFPTQYLPRNQVILKNNITNKKALNEGYSIKF